MPFTNLNTLKIKVSKDYRARRDDDTIGKDEDVNLKLTTNSSSNDQDSPSPTTLYYHSSISADDTTTTTTKAIHLFRGKSAKYTNKP